MASHEGSLRSVLDELERSCHEDQVSVGDDLETFQHRSLGVLLTVFGLIAALPIIGGLPGVSILAAMLILIAIGQSVLGGDGIWMPAFVRRRRIKRRTFENGGVHYAIVPRAGHTPFRTYSGLRARGAGLQWE